MLRIQITTSRIMDNLHLTRRQIEVLKAVAQHLTNREIADHLGLSIKTVELHIAASMQRLNARNRFHAVELARSKGMLNE